MRCEGGVFHVFCGVGAGGNSEHIVARFQLVALVSVSVPVVAIIGSVRIRVVHGDRDHLAFAWGKLLGLGKAHQHLGGFFNTAGGVGRRHIQLHHVAAGNASGIIGHFHFHRHGGVSAKGLRKRVRILELPGKVRIAQAVAKGICNRFVIMECVIITVLGFRVSRFVIAIANVDIFFLVHKVYAGIHVAQSAGGLEVGVAGIFIGHAHFAAKVVPGGVAFQRGKGIYRSAGGIDLAAENGAEGHHAAVAGETKPKDAVHRVVGGNVVDFHGGCHVEQHHDFVKALSGFFNHLFFVLIQLQIRAGHIEAFSADAGNDNQRGVVIFLKGRLHLIGIAIPGCFAGRDIIDDLSAVQVAGILGPPVAGSVFVIVETEQGGIVLETGRSQAVENALRVFIGATARARTAISDIDGVFTKHAHLCALGKRKGVIKIL